MSTITKGEVAKVTMTWIQAHFGGVMSGLLQLPYMSSNATGMEKEVIHSSWRSDPVEVKEFHLDDVRSQVHTTWKVIIPPFSNNKCAHQYQCQRTLYVGPHAHKTDARSPVAYSGGADGNLRRTSPGVLKGTHLSVQFRHPFHRYPHKDCGWTGSPCQLITTSGPPNKDFQRTQ